MVNPTIESTRRESTIMFNLNRIRYRESQPRTALLIYSRHSIRIIFRNYMLSRMTTSIQSLIHDHVSYSIRQTPSLITLFKHIQLLHLNHSSLSLSQLFKLLQTHLHTSFIYIYE